MKFCTAALTAALLLSSSTSAFADGHASPMDRRVAEENGWIYDDFDAGIAKAKETGQPLLVVLRCPP